MARARRGLDGRHRDKSGKIDRKHGNTRVAALRKDYGVSFAKGRRENMMLKTLLKETGSASLHEYLRQHSQAPKSRQQRPGIADDCPRVSRVLWDNSITWKSNHRRRCRQQTRDDRALKRSVAFTTR